MRPPGELRVVVTGHAGLDRQSVLQRICDYFESQEPKKRVKWYKGESKIGMASFLDAHWEKQIEAWRDSLVSELGRWERDKPDIAFLSLHLSYQRYGRIFSPLSWYYQMDQDRGLPRFEHPLVSLIKQRFKPHYCVTLIDDVMAVQSRIDPAYSFRLHELMLWRNLEIILTDFLARQVVPSRLYRGDGRERPFERSPVIALQHPRKMLYRYLRKSKTIPRLYLSYPISGPRQKPAIVQEINRFRNAFHDEFCVFDPVTIDETPLEVALNQDIPLFSDSGQDYIRFPASMRWDMENEDPLCGQPFQDIEKISKSEITEIVSKRETPDGSRWYSIIDLQIEDRDHRLIDQADGMVSYRPKFSGIRDREEFSHGTGEEWRYARQQGKTRFIIHDPEIDGEFPVAAFRLIPAETPYVVSMSPLSDPNVQKKAIEKVKKHIRKAFGMA